MDNTQSEAYGELWALGDYDVSEGPSSGKDMRFCWVTLLIEEAVHMYVRIVRNLYTFFSILL